MFVIYCVFCILKFLIEFSCRTCVTSFRDGSVFKMDNLSAVGMAKPIWMCHLCSYFMGVQSSVYKFAFLWAFLEHLSWLELLFNFFSVWYASLTGKMPRQIACCRFTGGIFCEITFVSNVQCDCAPFDICQYNTHSRTIEYRQRTISKRTACTVHGVLALSKQ